MLHTLSPRNSILMFLVFASGLGLALVFPWLADWQGYAAQNEAGVPGTFSAYRPTVITSTYYVAKDGNSSNPTGSWNGAYSDLQDALGAASAGDEIWVASGIYKPGDTVSDSFKLVPGVAVYGGFNGTETNRSGRDWYANATVLSGDIDGNDKTDSRGIVTSSDDIEGNNSFHVVYAEMVSGTAVLDGFTITGGNANIDKGTNDSGGGFYCRGRNTAPLIDGACSPQLVHIRFSGNAAVYGGGMFNDGLESTSDPTLRDVIFTGNSASIYGGGMVNYAQGGKSRPVLTNVRFSGNSAGEWGGAMANFGHLDGGENHPILINVTISGNRAADKGGGIFNFGEKGKCTPNIRNSIIWNNRDSSGTGTLTANIYNYDARTTLYHSCAQGSGGTGNFTADFSYADGGGNIDEDPQFAAPIDPIAITSAGDLRLKSGSPAIDAGDNDYVIDVLTDLDGEQRITDGNGDGDDRVDMGAYEYYPVYIFDQYLSIVFSGEK